MKKVVVEISTSEAMKLSIACSFTATAETISKADKTDLLRLSKKIADAAVNVMYCEKVMK